MMAKNSGSAASALSLDVGAKFVEIAIGPVEQIGPTRASRVASPFEPSIQGLGVRRRVQRRERDPPPFERDPLRPLGRMRASTNGPMGRVC